jgi:methylated-DNA-[protein]-cysteine S-methyltransferase
MSDITNSNYPSDEAFMRQARERLAAAAMADDLVDLSYAITDSPVGALLVALTRTGVVRVAFADERHDAVLQSLSARISPRIIQSAGQTDLIRRELDEYFDGRRATFSTPVDMSLVSGFQKDVLAATANLSYGSTVNYAQIANAAGNPKAARAAGTALGKNPLPIVIPCHRIVRADGSLGGYLGGVDAKAWLLATEREHRNELVG